MAARSLSLYTPHIAFRHEVIPMGRRRLLLTGASGHLGSYLLREVQASSHEVVAWSGSWRGNLFGTSIIPVDLDDADAVQSQFVAAAPHVVLHLAALASVAECHRHPARANRINHLAAAQVADLCAQCGARLLYVSTDLVFAGERGNYAEVDEPRPLSCYGRSKCAGEQAALAWRNTLVVRLSLVLGPSLRPERPVFYDQQVQALKAGQTIRCFADEWRTPLSAAWAARSLLHLLEWEGTGLLHLGGPERLTRLEMGQRLARRLGVSDNLVQPCLRADLPTPEPRPRDTTLDCNLFRRYFPERPWPTWDSAD